MRFTAYHYTLADTVIFLAGDGSIKEQGPWHIIKSRMATDPISTEHLARELTESSSLDTDVRSIRSLRSALSGKEGTDFDLGGWAADAEIYSKTHLFNLYHSVRKMLSNH
jgi:hypothetical protein